MNLINKLIFASTVIFSSIVYADGPTKFPSVPDMVQQFNDFSTDNGTFKVISKKPLHIQLSPEVFPNDQKIVISEQTERAAIYGIYRSFIHTGVDKITVTAMPKIYSKNDYLIADKVTITKTRAQALKDIQKFIPVTDFSELTISDEYGHDETSKEYKQIYYNDQGGAGLNEFFKYISKK
ncbi:hypothetical protein [Yersinia enterocolitica]|uniref:hypothetical protein n=1 Tax=Yersinia enterocolitica TaxID=630 RepID=UPI003F47ECA0